MNTNVLTMSFPALDESPQELSHRKVNVFVLKEAIDSAPEWLFFPYLKVREARQHEKGLICLLNMNGFATH